jgi:hypothetical protein
MSLLQRPQRLELPRIGPCLQHFLDKFERPALITGDEKFVRVRQLRQHVLGRCCATIERH